MFADLSINGDLTITAENETEGFAIARWFDGGFDGEYTLSVKPTRGLTLGPQEIYLKVAKKDTANTV